MNAGKKVILAIDDIVPILKSIKKTLESSFEVCLAKSVETASRILKTNRVDLILLDIAMPEMSGFEYMQQLRQTPQYRNIPVIIITAHATVELVAQAMSSGAKDFIAKPISRNILMKKVHAALEERPSQTVSREIMEQIFEDLKKICRKGMESKADALIKEIRNQHFSPAAGAHVAEICDLIALGNYKTALEKIKVQEKNLWWEWSGEEDRHAVS
jgi:PleD family two-component response regulator